MGNMKDLLGDTLFGEAYARGSDPNTSREAATAVEGKRASVLQLQFLKALEKYPNGLTLGQIETVTGVEWKTITPRSRPLKNMGAIEVRFDQGGNIIKRESTSSGRQQEVLFITDFGRQLLALSEI